MNSEEKRLNTQTLTPDQLKKIKELAKITPPFNHPGRRNAIVFCEILEDGREESAQN